MTRNLATRMTPIRPKPQCACWHRDADGNTDDPAVTIYNPECPVHGQTITE